MQYTYQKMHTPLNYECSLLSKAPCKVMLQTDEKLSNFLFFFYNFVQMLSYGIRMLLNYIRLQD